MPSHPTRHTIARQWELLKLLPHRYPGSTARQLQQALLDAGHRASKRTVERDLQELSSLFPLYCNDKGIPYGWYWQPGQKPALPGLPPGDGSGPSAVTGDSSSPLRSQRPEIELKAWVDHTLCRHLAETPLSPDMQLLAQEDGGALLSATLHDSSELLHWLLSHAGSIRLHAPWALRQAMLARLQAGVAMHQTQA